VGGLGLARIAVDVAKMLAGCAVMALACWTAQRVPGFPGGSGQLASMGQLAILMLVGGAAYLGTCKLLGVDLRLKTIASA
jgi:hypothetical protein